MWSTISTGALVQYFSLFRFAENILAYAFAKKSKEYIKTDASVFSPGALEAVLKAKNVILC